MVCRIDGKNPKKPFGDENPAFTFLEIYETIRSKGYNPDDVMWGLWAIEDPTSPYFGKTKSDRKELARSNWLSDVKEEDLEEFCQAFIDECMPPAMRQYYRLNAMYEMIMDAAWEQLTASNTKTVKFKNKETGEEETKEVETEVDLGPAQSLIKDSKTSAVNLAAAKKIAEEEWMSDAMAPDSDTKRKKKTVSTQAKPGLLAAKAMEKRKKSAKSNEEE